MAGRKMRIGPTGMRLHEWIGLEGNYWADEGLDVEVDWNLVQSLYRYGGLDYGERPQDEPFQKGEEIVCNALPRSSAGAWTT